MEEERPTIQFGVNGLTLTRGDTDKHTWHICLQLNSKDIEAVVTGESGVYIEIEPQGPAINIGITSSGDYDSIDDAVEAAKNALRYALENLHVEVVE